MNKWDRISFGLLAIAVIVLCVAVIRLGNNLDSRIDNLQPTPPTHYVFTECETGDTLWLTPMKLLFATIIQIDSCYTIEYHCGDWSQIFYVNENPLDLLKQGGAK